MPELPYEMLALPRSGIRVVMDMAWAHDGPVIHLEVGQPDRIPPDHIRRAMADSVMAGETGYTPNAGIPELRAACADKLGRVNGIEVDPDRVLVTAGSMQGLSTVMLGLLEPGDEVLVADPGWPNHGMAARIASAVPVPYPLRPERGFLPDPDELASLVTERTKMIAINSPSNPLGTVFDESLVEAIVDVAARHDLWVLSDECYDQIVHSGEVAPSPAAIDSERVVSVHSFSKTYAMTGLRVAYVSGPRPAVGMFTKMQEALVACVNGPAQRAAVAALTGPQDFVTDMRNTYRQRRDEAVATAQRLDIPHLAPEGAFYLWLPLGLTSSVDFCRRLIDDHGVAVAPGDTFGKGGEGAIRITLAAAVDDIVTGLERIAAAL